MRYILAGFQTHSLQSVVVDSEGMTIEHLVPQKLIGTEDFTEEIVGQLGNLILVPPALNTKLDDKSYRKKKMLKAAGFPIPAEFVNLDDITPADIQSRTANLADKAYTQVWKI